MFSIIAQTLHTVLLFGSLCNLCYFECPVQVCRGLWWMIIRRTVCCSCRGQWTVIGKWGFARSPLSPLSPARHQLGGSLVQGDDSEIRRGTARRNRMNVWLVFTRYPRTWTGSAPVGAVAVKSVRRKRPASGHRPGNYRTFPIRRWATRPPRRGCWVLLLGVEQ